MQRIIRWVIALGLVALPLAAQQNIAIVSQAQQALALADASGAQIYAKSLYDDAAYRIRFAQDNINSTRASMQAQAEMRLEIGKARKMQSLRRAGDRGHAHSKFRGERLGRSQRAVAGIFQQAIDNPALARAELFVVLSHGALDAARLDRR